ncbi:MAG: glutamine-hydrolyzing carbamoyl-phosphate synthase small subunit [Verrucomicrobia bacterium]|nr:glutamine-hydrolyzing carbamoyl-phosphate synthase small subunit [Verrucomicrobiota bacterium]
MKKDGLLMLEDGTLFWGKSVGAEGFFVGEVIFNTSMTGYQEILSDPSYAGQIINFTYPHIGNVGVNGHDMESLRLWPGGVVMKELSKMHSSWRATGDLQSSLKNQKIIAISGIDTRKLTHILREKGSLNACIMSGSVDPEFALIQARAFAGLSGKDLAKEVSCTTPYEWKADKTLSPLHVVVMDFGVKSSILQNLVDSGCDLTIVPAQTSAKEILKIKPHGIFLSNGPGDPAACTYAIEAIQILLEAEIPLFGICLGHQLLALASGAKTLKMENGHHGANHPIQEITSGQVFISSQNHGFVVEEKNLPSCLDITHRSLFDGTIAGLIRKDKPAFSFQGHPEASPGPHELQLLFKQFTTLMEHSHAKTN